MDESFPLIPDQPHAPLTHILKLLEQSEVESWKDNPLKIWLVVDHFFWENKISDTDILICQDQAILLAMVMLCADMAYETLTSHLNHSMHHRLACQWCQWFWHAHICLSVRAKGLVIQNGKQLLRWTLLFVCSTQHSTKNSKTLQRTLPDISTRDLLMARDDTGLKSTVEDHIICNIWMASWNNRYLGDLIWGNISIYYQSNW